MRPEDRSSSSLTDPELSLVTFYSLLCGATALIPVPFLDDWIFNLVRRYMVRDLLGKSGYRLAPGQARLLVDRPSIWEERGCLYGSVYLLFLAPLKVALYILKKLFRKIVFILAVKDATDRSVWTFHEAYLVLIGGHRARPFIAELNDKALALLRGILEETLRQTDTSPLSHVFKTAVSVNRSTLSRAGAFLVATWRRIRNRITEEAAVEAMHQEEDLLEKMAEDAARGIRSEAGHLLALEERFEACAKGRGFIPQA